MEKLRSHSGSGWRWKPRRRRKLDDDPLFSDGNAMCAQLKLILPRENEDILAVGKSDAFVCNLSGCGKAFSSVADYEMHHSLIHRNICSNCNRRFPNSHLLDLHVREEHDTVFNIQTENKNMYDCYVPTCSEKFKTPVERKKHTVSIHKYPANFRFDPCKQKKSNKTLQTSQSHVGAIPMETDISASAPVAPHCEMEKSYSISESGRRFVYKVPKDICFGSGSQRGFKRAPPRGRGKKSHKDGQRQVQKTTDVNQKQVPETPT